LLKSGSQGLSQDNETPSQIIDQVILKTSLGAMSLDNDGKSLILMLLFDQNVCIPVYNQICLDQGLVVLYTIILIHEIVKVSHFTKFQVV